MKRRVAYEPLELGIPEEPACPNKFERASELWCPGSKRLILQVGVNAVKVETGIMGPGGTTAGIGGIVWLTHETFFPCFAALDRDFDAVRVHNRYAGQEAQVLISVEQDMRG